MIGSARKVGLFIRRLVGRPSTAPLDGAFLYLDARTKRLRFIGSDGDHPVLSESTGGGAPTTAQYLTLATDATLTAERVLTVGGGIGGTDGGAGGAYVIAINDAGLVSLMAADAAAGLAYPSAANTWTSLTLAANKGVYATSASALATYDLTATGRTIGGIAAPAAAGQALVSTSTTAVGWSYLLLAFAITQSVDTAVVLDFASTPANAITSTGTIGGP